MFDTIEEIKNKAANGNVGIWVIDKKVKIVPVSQKKRFDSMCLDYSKEFKGVFTKDCPVSVLKDNLK